MPTRYGRSPWIDQFPRSRAPEYPRHRGPLRVEVAVVGGGLTGCATAYAFAAAGVKVAVFEADALGRGGTVSGSGWASDDPGPSFLDVEQRMGLRAARHVWQAWRRAALDFAALLKRLDIACRLESRDSLRVATTPEQAVGLKREQKARKQAGLDVSLLTKKAVAEESAIAAAAGFRARGGATIDPYRATVGLAAAAAERGAQVFEHTPVEQVSFTRTHADVRTPGGTVRVARVVIATGLPTPLCASLARHFRPQTAYLTLTEPIPARVRGTLGRRAAIVRDFAEPSHLLRWVDDERLLVCGADGSAVPVRQREQRLVQRTGQLMYELSTIYPEISGVMPAYGWDIPYAATADGLPFIGPHRNFPFHLFALGDSSRGVTGAYLASRVLLRHHLGEAEADDDAFGFIR